MAANLANDRKDLTVLLYRVNLCVVVPRAEVLLLARTVRQGALLVELLRGKNSFYPSCVEAKVILGRLNEGWARAIELICPRSIYYLVGVMPAPD